MAVNRYEVGSADDRPWGRWEVTDAGERFTVKRITVKPGAILSLQYHHGRDEHWVIVEGKARVTRGDDVLELGENESVMIKRGQHHRIENPGETDMIFVEVQYGEQLDEDDIIRVEDAYGRADA